MAEAITMDGGQAVGSASERPLLRKPWLKPGTLAWLSFHHTRLTMRRRMGEMTFARAGVMVLVIGLLLGIVISASMRVARVLADPATPEATVLATGGGLGAFISMLLLSSGLINTAQSIGERSDLDLMLSAPVPPERTAAARLLGATVSAAIFPVIIAASTLLMPAILVSPLYGLSLVAVAGLALFWAAVGQMVIVPLHGLIGARKARIAAQLTGIAVTAGPIIGFNMLAARTPGSSMTQALQDTIAHALANVPGLELLCNAMLGQPGPAFLVLAIGVGTFALSTRLFGRMFAINAASSGPTATRGRVDLPVRLRPRGLFSGAMLKEWRSIVRDPWLITQLGMQGFAIIPIMIVVHGMGGLGAIAAPVLVGVVSMLVLFSGQIAASLAWVTASTEQAQDLLDAAPVARGRMVLAKAATAFACAMVVVTGLSIWALASDGWQSGLAILVGAGANAICVILVELWRPKPAKKERMMRAGDRSVLSIGYAMLIGLCWGVAAGATMISGWIAAYIMAVVALGFTGVAWLTSPTRKR